MAQVVTQQGARKRRSSFEETQSGHSTCEKISFTTCVFASPFVFGVISSMRDIYVLKFGANVELMGVFNFIVLFVSAFIDPLTGYLQDTWFSWYECIMPRERWGKRAPYCTIAMICATVFLFLSYFPPSNMYEVWWLMVFLGCVVCTSTVNVGYVTSLFSLYKFKKERVIVEGYGYIMKTFGLLLGFASFVITLGNARTSVRFVQAMFGVGLVLIAIPRSMRIMSEVREDSFVKTKTQASFIDLWVCAKDLLGKSDSFQWLALIYATDASRGAMVLIITYYLTYTSRVSSDDRSKYIVFMLVGVLLIKVIMIIPMQSYAKRNGEKFAEYIQIIDVWCHVGIVISTIACFAWTRNANGILFHVLSREVLKTPHLFWTILSATWICDEDAIHKKESREGMIIGIANMMYILSYAVFASLYLVIAGMLGLDVADCSSFDDNADLYDACYLADQESQPQDLRDYFYYLFLIVYPTATVLMTFVLYKFPITGQRRKDLERQKVKAMKSQTMEMVDVEGMRNGSHDDDSSSSSSSSMSTTTTLTSNDNNS